MLDIIADVVYIMGLTLGAGSSTFALTFYIHTFGNPNLDATTKQLIHLVYKVLRLGMILIFIGYIGKLALHTHVNPMPPAILVLLLIITINAMLMTWHLMPMKFGPILAGGSWYALFFFSNTPIGKFSYETQVLGYLAFLIIFYAGFSFIKNIYAVRRGIFRGEVKTDMRTRTLYATDSSIFKILPKAIYYPKNTKDVIALIKNCLAQKKRDGISSISIRAGGSCMSGGSLNAEWVMDMTKHMKHIKVDAKNKTATVEMGAYFRDIEKAVKKHGLMFAPYPSSRLICGIGGMLGNNASGEKSLRHGATSDNILELEVVLADGTVRTIAPKDITGAVDVREKELLSLYNAHGATMHTASGEVKKSSAGYHFEKIVNGTTFNAIPLFVGAQGTLGIITKAVLKLTPIPEHTALVVISAQSLADTSSIIKTVYEHNPEGLETFDTNTFKKAQEHLSVSAEKLLPYIDTEAHLFILAQFSEDTKEATDDQAKKCFATLIEQGYFAKHVTIPEDVAGAWDVRRNSFTLMRDHNPPNIHAVPCIEDVIVPLTALGDFILSLRKILKDRNINYGYHGHIGDGSLRIIPLFDFTSPTLSDDIIGLVRDVIPLIKKLKGNISADHSDGIIRTPFLKEFYGEELYGVFEQIKKLYDPETILNPKKKVGGTIEYLNASIHR